MCETWQRCLLVDVNVTGIAVCEGTVGDSIPLLALQKTTILLLEEEEKNIQNTVYHRTEMGVSQAL